MPVRLHSARMDKGTLTPQGFLMVPAFFTRTGVFRYTRKDGTVVRELRHPDDVFHADSIASLKMAPLTDDHPSDMVTPDNYQQLSVGHISEDIKKDDDKLSGMVVVAQAKAIKRVQTGKKELSCGYHADTLEESGIYNGERYDCRQTNIRYNHVAIVERGRAGPEIRLRLDSEDAAFCDEENQPREDDNVKIKINGKEVEVSQEVYDSIMAERAEAKKKLDESEEAKKKAEDEAEEAKKEKEDAEGKLNASKTDAEKLTARVDSLEQKLKEKKDVAPEEMAAAVAERNRIEKTAKAVLGDDVKLDGVSNADLMKQVVEKQGVDVSKKTDVYIQARFDGIADDYKDVGTRRHSFTAPKLDGRKDDEFDSDAARKRQNASAAKAWEEPLATSKK